MSLTKHQKAWLENHPDRTVEWLLERQGDGFDIHHLDGNHENNDPKNLALMERRDHHRLHGINVSLPLDHYKRAGAKGGKARRPRGKREMRRAGRARARALTPERRSEIARQAAKIRWDTKRNTAASSMQITGETCQNGA